MLSIYILQSNIFCIIGIVTLFLLHSFHFILFSYCTFLAFHFFHVPLFSHITLFHVAIYHVTLFIIALFSSSTLFVLHFFHAVLFSCCTFQKRQEIKLRLLYIRSLIETLPDISSFLTRYDKYKLLRVSLLKEYWTRRGEMLENNSFVKWNSSIPEKFYSSKQKAEVVIMGFLFPGRKF